MSHETKAPASERRSIVQEKRRTSSRAGSAWLLLVVTMACSPVVESDRVVVEASPVAGATAADTVPRLIVLVSIDTLRADHLGVYGHHRFTSPVLDGLARDGVVFEDVSAPSPWTLPSHASMLTGLYPLRHKLMTGEFALSESIPTLASRLSQQGYATGAIVNAPWLKKENYQVSRDFELYLAIENRDYSRRAASTWVTDQALQWVDDAAGGKLFLFIHYYDVHSDYVSEPAYEKLFVTPYTGPVDGRAWQLKIEGAPDAHLELCRREFEKETCSFGSDEKRRNFDETTRKIGFDAAGLRRLEELYDAGVRQMDDELGRLVAGLMDRGVFEETLLVVTSDHGEEFMEHGGLEHSTTTFQETLRVPLVMRGSGVPKGLRVTAPVSLVDIVPTVLALAGAESAPDLDGSDLGPLLRGDPSTPFDERLLFGEASYSLAHERKEKLKGIYPIYWSVRRGHHKLVWESRDDRYWLFDLESDPNEEFDLSAEQPELYAELKSALGERYEAYLSRVIDSEQVELDPEELERLRALGYLQ